MGLIAHVLPLVDGGIGMHRRRPCRLLESAIEPPGQGIEPLTGITRGRSRFESHPRSSDGDGRLIDARIRLPIVGSPTTSSRSPSHPRHVIRRPRAVAITEGRWDQHAGISRAGPDRPGRSRHRLHRTILLPLQILQSRELGIDPREQLLPKLSDRTGQGIGGPDLQARDSVVGRIGIYQGRNSDVSGPGVCIWENSSSRVLGARKILGRRTI